MPDKIDVVLKSCADLSRYVSIDSDNINVKTDHIDDMLYAFYLYKSNKLIDQHQYTENNFCTFNNELTVGSYSARFFYKFDGKATWYAENFMVIEKCGSKEVRNVAARSLFVGNNDEPVLKRFLKESISKKLRVLKNEAKKLGDSYPGKRFDIVVMTLPASEALGSEYLFIAIDSFSKEMYFDIYGSTSYIHVASFIENLIAECPYSIDHINIDNTLAIKGLSKLSKLCKKVGIKYDLVSMYQFINKSKSLAVIDGLIKELYRDMTFESKRELVEELVTLTNKYNFLKKI
ncbi:hypothetical protein [Francisella salimarina]|uniref:hypothetical protein n=1 Tax=Francisella salimarina TaxID=2599927 RepID=UPI003D819A4F